MQQTSFSRRTHSRSPRPGSWGLFFVLLSLLAFGLSSADSTLADTTTPPPEVADSSAAVQKAAPPPAKKAGIIRLDGTVDPGMASYVKRSIAEAQKQSPDLLIFIVNTFGGRLDAAFDIVDTLSALRGIPTISLVSQKAISAGALISLACTQLYMLPATTIGDVAPVIQSQEGPQVMGEKIQSPLRAKFRNLAQRHGYPELLSEAMVTAELEVLRFDTGDTVLYMLSSEYEELPEEDKEALGPRKTVVRAGELLTMTENEAFEFGFSRGTVENLDELKTLLGVTESFTVEISWAESLARVLGMMAPVLMLIGFGALYMEFQTPGFGLFGIIGIAALALVFGGQYVSGLAGNLPLVLLLLGALLMAVEIVFVPGTWMAGITGVALMFAAMVLSLKNAPLPMVPQSVGNSGASGLLLALAYVVSVAAAALAFPILAARFVLPHLPRNMSLMLADDMADAVSPHEVAHDGVEEGALGVARTDLRPVGRARFADTDMDVQSRDEWIEAGTLVCVVRVQGNTIWVARSKEST